MITAMIRQKKTNLLLSSNLKSQPASQIGSKARNPEQTEGNLSSYRTSNIDYGSLLEGDSYYSEY
jgi:hypothetical protein